MDTKTMKETQNIEAQMFKTHITPILLIFALLCISFQPVSATTSLNETNATIVSDLNQTAGKDLISLVDTTRLDIGNHQFFDVIWSPDGNHMLIDTFVSAYPKGEYQPGGIDALYAANEDGSQLTRIAWTERTSREEGRAITAPMWSHSGDYFSYLYLEKGNWYQIKSAHLFVMSNDLNFIQKIELDPNVESESDPSNFRWSPKENKIAAFIPGKITIYDLDENNNVSFSIPGDNVDLTNMEWSPDGKKLVILKNNHDVITLDIEKRQTIPIFSAENVGGVQWSPDSKKILFYELKTSKQGNDLSYDMYVKDEAVEKPLKIRTFNSGFLSMKQWYPDNEKFLIRVSSGGSYTLYSLSMTGDLKKLIEENGNLDGMVTPNGHIVTTSPNPGSRNPPYTRTYDLSLLNGTDRLTIENVAYHAWKDADLLFVKDNRVSVLNTSTKDICDITLPSTNSGRIRFDPSGHFIAVDNIVFGLYDQESYISTNSGNATNSTTPEVAILKNDMAEHLEPKTTTEPSELPGFTAILVFMGILIALACMHMKK
ncbi:TolB family protein [Methanococcoides sp.]|uniref:TolB family protein n=1 Tax=Methanococcoides sp. TaxID=1966350 RepID=UPI00272EE3DB|nr:hypothetical protein [Methanococcoides sp.]